MHFWPADSLPGDGGSALCGTVLTILYKYSGCLVDVCAYYSMYCILRRFDSYVLSSQYTSCIDIKNCMQSLCMGRLSL